MEKSEEIVHQKENTGSKQKEETCELLSKTFTIRKIQIKTTVRNHSTFIKWLNFTKLQQKILARM